MPDIFINSGQWAYIIVFMVINGLILLIAQLFARNKILLIISSILTFIPAAIGYVGTTIGKIQVEQIAPHTNDIDIIKESLVIANSPMTLGLLCSAPLVVLCLINVIIYFKLEIDSKCMMLKLQQNQ